MSSQPHDLAFPAAGFLTAAMQAVAARGLSEEATPPRDFLEQYRGDAFPEDMLDVGLEEAAGLALDLWAFSREKRAADPSGRFIRVRSASGSDGEPLAVDVIEIVGPDMAFLVDSAIAACQDARAEVRAVLHPVIDGRSLIQIHVTAMDDAGRQDLHRRLEETFADVAVVNADHQAMRARMQAAIASLDALPSLRRGGEEEVREAQSFLQWLVDNSFTFLGARDYTFARGVDGELMAEEPIVEQASGLGVLRDVDRNVLSRSAEPTVLTPAIRGFLNEPEPIIVAKASMSSRVHRRTYADYVGVKRYDEKGEVIGETRFVGLFTSEAYTRSPDQVPLIRRKIAKVKDGMKAASRFSRRRLNAVLQTYPRDELFQISEDDLGRIAMAAARLQIRPRTRLFIRRDRFDRYVSALLYTPRDSYTSELRTRAHRMLADAYGGRPSAFYPYFGDGPLTRVHLIIGLSPGHPEPDEDALDLAMRQMFESWEDALVRVSRAKAGAGAKLASGSDVTRARFTAGYREAFTPDEGLADLSTIAALPVGQSLRARVWTRDFESGIERIKLYRRDQALDLAEIVPVMERMGLHVRAEVGYPIRFVPAEDRPDAVVYVHDLAIDRAPGQKRIDSRFEDAFEAIWSGRTENDRFNSLVVALGVDWREAALLRTLARFRMQSGLDPSELVQVAALRDHPDISNALLELFAIRLDPARRLDLEARRKAAEQQRMQIVQMLDAVATLDADRVLRRILSLICAVVRTNFYLPAQGGGVRRHIAIKIASREADPLPAPRPFREIFVWSPEVEGVHLRFGPVARGGLRWSDRRDDFRTEVLSLVKAQQVKNAVIVPVGSKGGFYPKLLPVGGAREAVQAAGVSAYRTFIGALLELTDNLIDGKPERPAEIVNWDGDDPYLVVAADKGTAAFSDIANGISAEHGFWLADAFASGGSVGYDHKKMGITARGAWVAVQRHFRELGHDVQTQPFSVVGIGDMSGDVFGNGMLLSKAIRLVAAFDHRHIFLDPDPQDLEASFRERRRMFDLPRSSWADYDKTLISGGGGVFERGAKSIALSPEVKALTGLSDDAVTPDVLIRALLKAPVDLLWFGGIGAYVKASGETHADVGDKANDGLRVEARDVRAKVIAEGANLGVTQAGRIEFARHGGRINTDAIDNSAGVDSSDHEVNIKILLAAAIGDGSLKAGERDALLASMTDDVASHVLRNNYDQTGALSVMQASSVFDLDSHERLIEWLESGGRLDRAVEGLPSAEQFRRLRDSHLGLTRPELAVVMAYAKIELFDALVESDGPDDPAFEPMLSGYFPDALKPFSGARRKHRLRREIIATRLSNQIVNLTGPGFAAQKREAEGLDAGRIARGFAAAYEIFGFADLLRRIEDLDNTIAPGGSIAAAQTLMAQETSANLRMLAGGFASDALLAGGGSAGDLIERYGPGVAAVRKLLPAALSDVVASRVEARAEKYRLAGAPDAIARDVALVRALASARETVDVAARTGWPLETVAFIQHQVGRQLGLDRLRAAARDLEPRDPWDRLALNRVADDLPRQQTELTIAAIESVGTSQPSADRAAAEKLVSGWIAPHGVLADRLVQPMASFDRQGGWSLAKLVLLGDAVRDFVYAVRAREAPRTR